MLLTGACSGGGVPTLEPTALPSPVGNATNAFCFVDRGSCSIGRVTVGGAVPERLNSIATCIGCSFTASSCQSFGFSYSLSSISSASVQKPCKAKFSKKVPSNVFLSGWSWSQLLDTGNEISQRRAWAKHCAFSHSSMTELSSTMSNSLWKSPLRKGVCFFEVMVGSYWPWAFFLEKPNQLLPLLPLDGSLQVVGIWISSRIFYSRPDLEIGANTLERSWTLGSRVIYLWTMLDI